MVAVVLAMAIEVASAVAVVMAVAMTEIGMKYFCGHILPRVNTVCTFVDTYVLYLKNENAVFSSEIFIMRNIF